MKNLEKTEAYLGGADLYASQKQSPLSSLIEEKNYCVQCGREVEKNTPLCSDCRLEI